MENGYRNELPQPPSCQEGCSLSTDSNPRADCGLNYLFLNRLYFLDNLNLVVQMVVSYHRKNGNIEFDHLFKLLFAIFYLFKEIIVDRLLVSALENVSGVYKKLHVGLVMPELDLLKHPDIPD